MRNSLLEVPEESARLMIRQAGGVGDGWALLPDGERLQPGDGFLHPSFEFWTDFQCRPDMFRGRKEHVHSGWPWRRKIDPIPQGASQ